MEVIKGVCGGVCGVVGCLVGVGCAVAPIVLTVYQGIYAFNNPDNEAWLGVVPSGENKLYADQEAGNLDKATGLVDIHARFVTWFLWGFLTSLSPLVMGLLFLVATLINPNLGGCMGAFNACAIGCSGLAWWITGIVWRFRADGAFVSGDLVPEGKTQEEWLEITTAEDSLYQYKSGHFMAIYYFVCFAVVGFGCLTSGVGAVYACLTASKG